MPAARSRANSRMATRSGIGDAPKRREDLRFLTGSGHYLDDLQFESVAHAAKAMPGVLAVLTAADVQADGLRPLLPYVDANTVTGEPFAFMPQPLLAEGKVRYVGEPVALVVAERREQALDAAEHVAID